MRGNASKPRFGRVLPLLRNPNPDLDTKIALSHSRTGRRTANTPHYIADLQLWYVSARIRKNGGVTKIKFGGKAKPADIRGVAVIWS